MQNNPRIIFFGTSAYAVIVLDELIKSGMIPVGVITTPDKPAGKHLELTASPVKKYAEENNLKVFQPEKLKDQEVITHLKSFGADIGVVVAYGKIIPQEIIDIVPHGLLNVHASLLPKLRGASPIETAILQNMKNTGVTIMVVDKEMDHGPIVTEQEVVVEPWPPQARELGTRLVETGAKLLIKVIPDWMSGKITATPQNESEATYTKKIDKSEGLINLTDSPYENFLKIQAFHEWPTTYFFAEKNISSGSSKKIRVIIKKAEYINGELVIKTVVPEGKKEMSYNDFIRSL